MKLTQELKKFYRTIGHELNPIITIADKGVTDNILAEADRALEQHELIKVKFSIADREERANAIELLREKSKATLVQQIGKTALYLRRAKQPHPKLSNLIRFQNLK